MLRYLIQSRTIHRECLVYTPSPAQPSYINHSVPTSSYDQCPHPHNLGSNICARPCSFLTLAPVAVTRLLQLQRDRHFFPFCFQAALVLTFPSSFLVLPSTRALPVNLRLFVQLEADSLRPASARHRQRLRAVLSPRSTVLASPCSSFLQPPYTHSATACEGHQHGCSRPSPPHPLQPGHRQGMTTPPKLSTLTSVKGTNKTPPRPTSCRVFAGRLVELLRVSSRG